MKKLICILASMLYNNVFSQNLILNPSFEDSTGTMWQFSNSDPNFYHLCKFWDNPNYFTTDYSYNTNLLGPPQNGLAYVAFNCFSENQSNSREYAQGELSTTLIQDNVYQFTTYVYLDTISNWKLCSLQVAFLNSKFYVNAGVPISFTNAIDINISSIGTKTWVPCSVSYTASGGEKYIIIGNMKNDVQLTCKTKFTTTAFNESYYHIDNLSLIQTTVNTLNEINEVENLFQVFPNPANEKINIKGTIVLKVISKNLIINQYLEFHFTNNYPNLLIKN